MPAPYINRQQIKSYAGQVPHGNATIDDVCDQVIKTASRATESYTGRRFYADTVATARVYGERSLVRTSGWLAPRLQVDDIADRTAVTVAVDTDGTGTYDQVWDPSDFFLEPLNGVVDGIEGWPAEEIVAVTSSKLFPVFSTTMRPQIQVTAKWGWPAVPDAVTSAVYMTALDLLKMKDAPFGQIGFAEYGPVKARANLVVASLLDKTYCKSTIGIA